MGQRMQRVDSSSIADRCEISNPYRVLLGSDGNIVPDSCPLADNDFTNKCGIRSNPSVLDLWHTVVKWHNLAMARRLLQVGNVIGKVATNTIKLETGLFLDSAKVVLESLGELASEESWSIHVF